MSEKRAKPGVWGYFRGGNVWFGIALALAGTLCEEFVGREHGFESLIFFGALSLGLGLGGNIERSRKDS